MKTSTLFYLLDSREQDRYSVELHDFSEFEEIIEQLGDSVKVPDIVMKPIKELIKSFAIE